MKRTTLQLLLVAGLLLATSPALPQAADPNAPALDLRDVDIRAFIQDVSRATGLTFVTDPRVQGTVSISRGDAMSQSELLGVLVALLRANGLVAVPSGAGTYRVVPDDTAAQQPGTLGGAAAGFATQVIHLSNVDARLAVETLKPLVGRGGIALATPDGNSVLIADYADNLRRLREVLAQIDRNRSSIETVTLRNSSARDVAGTVGTLFGGKAGGAPVSVLPVDSSNSIVVRGEPATVARAVQTILELDKRAERVGEVEVVELQHASAEQLLPVLQQLAGVPASAVVPASAAMTGATLPAAESNAIAGVAGVAALPGRRATIARAPGRNALVIHADPETQRMLLDVVRKLDKRRPQVMVEAIVVEISDQAARNLGVQLALAGREGSRVPFTATQFPTSGTRLMPLIGGALLKDTDSALGDAARNAALQSLLGINGSLTGLAGEAGNLVFGAIINAVKSDTGSNLLSTPSILTLDNEKARIMVGQEVPITTGEVLGDGNSNPFRTIERQNVGIQLEVVPQITASGITLRLRQEVSSVAGPVSENFNELILNKRVIETQVLVDDGAIVALGGLLDQADRNTVEKVPGLGDLPVLGGLFRNTARSRQKTNLMVFIRPTVIRDGAAAARAAAPRYEYMRQAQLQLDDRRSEAELDVLLRDYLRALPPRAPAAAPATPSPARP